MAPKHKLKLHKAGTTSGLQKAVASTQNGISEEPSTSTSCNELQDSEASQQFEVELCWCIQQLQNALKSNKLNPRQVQDHTKALNTLMSNSAPVIKKRQVMRLSFGDYRAKMAAENQRLSKSNLKIQVTQATPSKKSLFIKKCAIALTGDKNFKFDFPVPENAVVEVEDMNAEKADNIGFQFTSSDNNFRFNFNSDAS